MKIAVVDPAAYSLPYDDALCAALAARGHDVTLFTTRFAHGPMPTPRGYRCNLWFYRGGIPFLPRRIARGIQHPRDMLRLRLHLRRTGFDIAHLQWSVLDQLDARVFTRTPIPTVFTAHNAAPREGQGESLDCERLRLFDAVVAHSAFGEASLRERCDLPRLWRIPHGSLDAYVATPDPAQPPAELGDGPVVALPGLLRSYKGVDVLLAAWPAVRRAIPGAQLLIAGRPMGIQLPDPPPEGVTLLTHFLQDADFAWVLRRANLVCLPYTAIDLSGVLFSALALGRPLLLSDVGGFREFEGAGAELVEAGNPDALATRIIDLLEHPARLAALARQAQVTGETTYNWDSIAETYEQRYAELLAAPGS
jgi:glycosyltransferase involved in cell wall biosynthesis